MSKYGNVGGVYLTNKTHCPRKMGASVWHKRARTWWQQKIPEDRIHLQFQGTDWGLLVSHLASGSLTTYNDVVRVHKVAFHKQNIICITLSYSTTMTWNKLPTHQSDDGNLPTRNVNSILVPFMLQHVCTIISDSALGTGQFHRRLMWHCGKWDGMLTEYH